MIGKAVLSNVMTLNSLFSCADIQFLTPLLLYVKGRFDMI